MDNTTNAGKSARPAARRNVNWDRFQKVRDQKAEVISEQRNFSTIQPEQDSTVEDVSDVPDITSRLGSADPSDIDNLGLRELLGRNRRAPCIDELWRTHAEMRGDVTVKIVESSIGGFYCRILEKDSFRSDVSDGRNRIFVPYRDFIKKIVPKPRNTVKVRTQQYLEHRRSEATSKPQKRHGVTGKGQRRR